MPEIAHKKDQSRFELMEEGKKVGEMTYSASDDRMIINHTEVDEQLSGKGFGKKLVEAGVLYARENNIKLVPMCSFAQKTIDENSDWQDVL